MNRNSERKELKTLYGYRDPNILYLVYKLFLKKSNFIAELVEENHSLLPSGSDGDFSNQNGFSGLNQDEEEEPWQEQQNDGEEQKRSEEGEETETDDGDIFLSVEEPSQSGHQQQQVSL